MTNRQRPKAHSVLDPHALKDKVAVITGGAGDIAGYFAKALAEAGASIALIDMNARKVVEAAQTLSDQGHQSIGLAANVGKREEIERAVSEIIERWGGIDILVNNAGYATTFEFQSIPEEEFDQVVNANLKGAFLMAQLVAPSMISRGGGKIVNLTSIVSKLGPDNLVHYVSAKTGVVGLTRALASALGPHNITVNGLAPGMVATAPIIKQYPEAVLNGSAMRRSIPRWEYAEDLVGTLTFLCSPGSDFMTGQTIMVDGGQVFD